MLWLICLVLAKSLENHNWPLQHGITIQTWDKPHRHLSTDTSNAFGQIVTAKKHGQSDKTLSIKAKGRFNIIHAVYVNMTILQSRQSQL